MTDKEKALAYDKALERAKQVCTEPYTANWDIMKDLIEHLFPELRKSEDEKISKRIIDLIRKIYANAMSWITHEEFEEMIAWLEKQGQVKESEISQHENKSCKENCGSLTQDKAKPKPTEDVDAEKASVNYRNYRMSCGITDPIMLDEIEEAYYEGAIRQKPVNKQDYSGLNGFERAIHRGFLCAGVENVPVTIIKETAQDCLSHIAQKPAEWSEEDEAALNKIIAHFDWTGNNRFTKNDCEWAQSWLKSLRPQKRWKPTKEQIEAVRIAAEVGTANNSWAMDKLKILYDDLKKLKE